MSLKESMLIMHVILTDAREQLLSQVNDPEIAPLRNRIAMDLGRHINFLAVNTGKDPITDIADVATGQSARPLKKLFGKALPQKTAAPVEMQVLEDKPVQLAGIQKTPQEVEAEELAAKVLELYPQFNTIETDAIIDTYSELEIRAVGKTAGLPVTETSPKKVDAKFVNQIKEAIKKKAEIEAQGNPE